MFTLDEGLHNATSTPLPSCPPGHYILLVGFDSGVSEYLVRDPAAMCADLHVSATAVDQARRSFGTDEDLLIVTLGPTSFAHSVCATVMADAAVSSRRQEAAALACNGQEGLVVC